MRHPILVLAGIVLFMGGCDQRPPPAPPSEPAPASTPQPPPPRTTPAPPPRGLGVDKISIAPQRSAADQ